MLFNPQWIKDPVYAVVREATTHGGILSTAELTAILANSGLREEDDCQLVTALMLECELCFKIQASLRVSLDRSSEPEYLVIDGLPAKDPQRDLVNWSSGVSLIWRFNFLPDHLLAQLLGRKFMWRDESATCYRDEVVLKSPDNQAQDCRVRIRPLPEHRRLDLIENRRLDLPAGCCLELEFTDCNDADRRYLRTRLEDEVIRILDPEGLTDQPGMRRPFVEIEPEKEQSATLTGNEIQLVQNLLSEIEEHCCSQRKVLSGPELLRLRHDLTAVFLATNFNTQPARSVAYRAYYIVYRVAEIMGEPSLERAFPPRADTASARFVGEWLEKNSEFKRLFAQFCQPHARTLDRDSTEKADFDRLRKNYENALKTMRNKKSPTEEREV